MGIYQSLCVAATTLPFLYLYINISFLMYHGRASIRLGRLTGIRLGAKRTYATTSYSTPAPHPSRITDADVHAARTYCATLLQKFDSPSYTLQTFVPPSARDAYLSIRALNIELSACNFGAIISHAHLRILHRKSPSPYFSIMPL